MNRQPAAGERRTSRRLGGFLYAVALLLLHGSLFYLSTGDRRALFGDEIMYLDGATLLASGADWRPEPLWPPLYPRFLACLLPASGSLAPVFAAQLTMLMAAAFLLGDLTRRLTGSRIAAIVAGGLVPLYPPLAAFAYFLWPEVLHLLLLVAAFWLLVARAERVWGLFAAGLLLGLALLAKSLLGPFLPVLLLPLVVAGTARDRLRRVAWVALGVGLAIAPDVTSNLRRATGVLIADSTAFNLWVGINDRSRKDLVDLVVAREMEAFQRSADTFAERREIVRRKFADRRRAEGLLSLLGRQLGRQYFRLFDKDSFLTDQLPGGAVIPRGLGYRDPPAALAAGLKAASYSLYAAVLVAAAAGLAILAPGGRPGAIRPWLRVIPTFLLYNLVIFLAFHVKSRYRIQLLPWLFLYSGCAAAWAATRLGFDIGEVELWRSPVSAKARIVATAGAAILLFLAFGRALLD